MSEDLLMQRLSVVCRYITLLRSVARCVFSINGLVAYRCSL
jgi:hypothetical protein